VLILSYVWLEEKELASHKPRVVVLDDANEIVTVKDHSALWPEE
jgi:aspartate 1-decarboxylase